MVAAPSNAAVDWWAIMLKKVFLIGAVLFILGNLVGEQEDNKSSKINTADMTTESAVAAGFATIEEYRAAVELGAATPTEFMLRKAEETFYKAPEKQLSFVKIIENARAAYREERNELAQGGLRRRRGEDLCGLLQTARISDWAGIVKELSSNNDGRGILGVTIGDDIALTTWNNAASDIMHRTLIDPDSQVFRLLSTISEGQRIKFSGVLYESDVDCFLESSLTMGGSMRSPEFIIRFTDIQIMDDSAAIIGATL